VRWHRHLRQWERGERQPTGAALKLLHVVEQNGLDALR
jgi:putative transcriptional regulator